MTPKFRELSGALWDQLMELRALPAEPSGNPADREEYERRVAILKARYAQSLHEAVCDVVDERLREAEAKKPRRPFS